MTGHEGSVRGLPSPVRDDIESAAKCIPLAVKSLNRLNRQESSEFRRDLTRDGLVQKPGAESDPECRDERKSRRQHFGSIDREILNRKEGRVVLSSMKNARLRGCLRVSPEEYER